VLPLDVTDLTMRGQHGPIINDLSLHIEHPGVSVVMGPNGAGKSVLLRLLHGLLVPDAGSIRWNGAANSQKIRLDQALLFQRPVMLRRSVMANIQFVLHQRGLPSNAGVCKTWLERLHLGHKSQQAARRLSGGEQQRLALARALALEPRVLFMDEPAASLDPSSTKTIEDVVMEQKRLGTKIIFVTHDVAQARRVADEVIFLHHGQVLEHSPATDFFDHPRSEEARRYLAGEIVL